MNVRSVWLLVCQWGNTDITEKIVFKDVNLFLSFIFRNDPSVNSTVKPWDQKTDKENNVYLQKRGLTCRNLEVIIIKSERLAMVKYSLNI